MKVWLALLSLAVCELSSTPAPGSVIFNHTMETFTVGAPRTFSSNSANLTSAYNNIAIRDQATATPFGSTNRFVALYQQNCYVRYNSISSLTTWRFDYYEPAATNEGGTGIGICTITGAGDINAAGAYTAWFIDDGVITLLNNTAQASGSPPTLQVGRRYIVHVFYNGSGSTATIPNTGGATINHSHSALFFYDTTTGLLIDGGRYSHTASVTPGALIFRQFNVTNYNNVLYFDNVSRDNTLTLAPFLFDHTMEAYSPGLTQDISDSPATYQDVNILDAGTATPFGSSNRFASISATNSFARYDGIASLSTWKFDFYEPSSGNSGSLAFGIGNSDVDSANAYTAWNLDDGVLSPGFNTTLTTGTLPTLEMNRHYVAYVLYNGSGTSMGIGYGGHIPIPARQSALLFYDTVANILIDAGRFSHTASVTPTGFIIRSFATSDNTLYFDNISLQSDVLRLNATHAIPTLGEWGFIILFATILIVGGRRLWRHHTNTPAKAA